MPTKSCALTSLLIRPAIVSGFFIFIWGHPSLVREKILGGSELSLATARELATKARRMLAAGLDNPPPPDRSVPRAAGLDNPTPTGSERATGGVVRQVG